VSLEIMKVRARGIHEAMNDLFSGGNCKENAVKMH
jgi:hypothetical protein